MHICFDALSDCLLLLTEEMDAGLAENVMTNNIRCNTADKKFLAMTIGGKMEKVDGTRDKE
jgi:hypothetical protein